MVGGPGAPLLPVSAAGAKGWVRGGAGGSLQHDRALGSESCPASGAGEAESGQC